MQPTSSSNRSEYSSLQPLQKLAQQVQLKKPGAKPSAVPRPLPCVPTSEPKNTSRGVVPISDNKVKAAAKSLLSDVRKIDPGTASPPPSIQNIKLKTPPPPPPIRTISLTEASRPITTINSPTQSQTPPATRMEDKADPPSKQRVVYNPPALTFPKNKSIDSSFDKFSRFKKRGDDSLIQQDILKAIEWYGKALKFAEKKRDTASIQEALKCIAQAFLEKDGWITAAKIINCAFALSVDDKEGQQVCLSLMADIESRFLDKVCCIKGAKIQKEKYLEWRKQLQAARQSVQNKMKKNQPSQIILKEFSVDISALLESIFYAGYAFFGQPPCSFTVLGLGSGGRQEMSPYSDLEFAVLIKDNAPKNLDYFRRMVKWLEIQVINLGETEFPILENNQVSPTRPGFQFDKGGNTLLAKHIELINDPKGMANFQTERYCREDFILTNTLKGAGFQFGSLDLYKDYLKAMRPILNRTSKAPPLTVTQERTLETLRGHLKEFAPQIDEKKEDLPYFDIKAELYRLPNFLITGLADYFGIDETNTWDKLDHLVKKKILSSAGADDLKKALSTIMALRIRCHLHYGQECDKAYHPSITRKNFQLVENPFILSDDDVNKIFEIYRVIFPLDRIFKQVCMTTDFKELAKARFYDTSLQTQAETNDKLCRYEEAKKCYLQALALNPDDMEIMIARARNFLMLSEHQEAQKCAEKVIAWGERQKNISIVASALNIQVVIYRQLNDDRAAIFCFSKAMDIALELKDPSSVLECMYNLGGANRASGQIKNCIMWLEKALKFGKEKVSPESPVVVGCLNGLGVAWDDLNERKKAIESYEEALRIAKKIYGIEHPLVA